MMKKRWYVGAIASFLLLITSAWSASFDVNGLKRIPKETLLNYVPKKSHLTQQDIIRSLYETGFFEQVRVSQKGNHFVIYVKERPVISMIKITGNSAITTDKLKTVMTALNLIEGRPFSPVALNKLRQGLLYQYRQMGRLNAEVNTTVTPANRNRVQIQMTISEGLVTKIERINIIGNKAFSEREIIKNLNISTPGLLTFITQEDRYSEEKLQEAVERIKNFYLDHGYLHVNVSVGQAQLSSDKKSAIIHITIQEGVPYILDSYAVAGHVSDLHKRKLEDVLRAELKLGQPFSRKSILDTQKKALSVLGADGYVFANINLLPQVNEEQKKLKLVFVFEPGKKAYVRKIQFSDNNQTNDYVLRREVKQFESAPVSVPKLERAKQKINLLPYIRDVQMTLQPVPAHPDQVDIDYRVKESDDIASMNFRVGYSQMQHLIYGATFNHKNLFGTGNSFGINLTRSRYLQSYGIDYTNPYYTDSGISRSFSFSFDKLDPQAVNRFTNISYTSNQFNAGVLFGIPLSDEGNVFTQFQTGFFLQDIRIKLNANPNFVSAQVNQFINKHGDHYLYGDVRLGLVRDGRDRSIFPTSGALHTIVLDTYVPMRSRNPAFYSMDYQTRAYYPLSSQFILTGRAQLSYGNAFSGVRNYPFFKNFYAGGIETIRGYDSLTLGSRDSLGKSYGGNILAVGSLGLIFPNFISDNLRTTAFVDAGNAFSRIDHVATYGGYSSNAGPLRYSAGIQADWMTPFGPVIQVSLAKAIKPQPIDVKEVFQFSLGANF